MKRKRFKKLCMGYQVSRQSAENLAFMAWLLRGSYAAAWPEIRAELQLALLDVQREKTEEKDPSTPADASAQDDRTGTGGRMGLDPSAAAAAAPFPKGSRMREGVSVCE